MTVALNYASLVTQTFCDNAIRSVMMIDDEFLSYPALIEGLKSKQVLATKLVENSSRAAELEKFFQSKNILCDIDNSAEHAQWDKIRKSDLIIIDYHLENDSPKKTLEILNDLQTSQHMNLAVVYTNEPLETVWKQIASSLVKKYKTSDVLLELDIDELDEIWEKIILDDTYNLSNDEISEYLNTKLPPKRISNRIEADEELLSISSIIKAKYDNPNDDFQLIDNLSTLICNYQLEQISHEFGINPTIESSKFISNKNGNKWIKINNIFICLVNKVDRSTSIDTPPQKIWDTLNESLIEWKPTYYQLMQSEIQNFIESNAFAFSSKHDNEILSQAAWLNEILKSTELSQFNIIQSLFKNLSEDLFFKFKKSSSLNRYIDNIFLVYKEKFTKYPSSNQQKSLEFCAKEMNIAIGQDTYQDMYHALNMHASSKNYEEKHISTGTVFLDKTYNKWYLCVSAACDMVPAQGNDPHHIRLTPHKIIKVLELFKVSKPRDALRNASHSNYIYILDGNKPLYLSIVTSSRPLPSIDYLLLKDQKNTFTNQPNIINGYLINKDSTTDNPNLEEIELKVKSQLRTGYAERFQSVAAQYTARIGVDYFNEKTL
ncbi:response regulator receiver domain [Acinetobacter pittii]|uniref:response regulator receiver domain n=2 Tax=Acinetobacter TaxID=469 RepID=UPI002E7A0E73|nr:response regulator receiver domain [Acinetobacter pittii]WVH56047.1 response regulator receiver domain [Acinetobacter pittii]